MGSIIAHIDMDAFFASVEERNKPYLNGLPIAVGSDPEGGAGRGVVATANYPARRYGIRSATPIQTAWKLSEAARAKGLPPVVFISGDYHTYEDASRDVFSLIKTRFRVVEQVGIDEGYVDCTSFKSYRKAADAMRGLQKEIRTKLGLPCSVGIAPSKMFAKIASDMNKPDGLVALTPKSAQRLLPTLPVEALPGIGRKSMHALARKGIRTVADARTLQWDEMVDLFGAHGFSLYERVWGSDDREVSAVEEDAKSIGDEITLRHDIRRFKDAIPVLETEAATVVRRMKEHGFTAARTVTAVVRLSDFTTFTRSLTPRRAVRGTQAIATLAMKLVLPAFDRRDNPNKQGVRLLGIRLSNLLKTDPA